MDMLVLKELRESIRHQSHEAAVRDAFERQLAHVDSFPMLRTLRSVQKLSGRRLWKFMGPGFWRLLFTVNRSPKSHTPYVVVHAILDHDTYDGLDRIASLSELSLSERLHREDVASYAAELDRGGSAREGQLTCIGLTDPIKRSWPGEEVAQVSESGPWVEEILNPLRQSGSKGESELEIIGDALLGVLKGGEETLVGKTLIYRTSDDVRIISATEATEAPIRRRWGLDPDSAGARERIRQVHEAAEAATDPFLISHWSQDRILDELAGNHWNALPALLDGPGGSGKTSLLLMIAKGVLQNGRGSSIRIVTATPKLAKVLSLALSSHLHLVDHVPEDEARNIADRSVSDINTYLRTLCDDRVAERFSDGTQQVTWARFFDWYHSFGIPDADGRRQGAGPMSAHATWSIFRSLIDGDRSLRGDTVHLPDSETFLRTVRGLPANRLRGIEIDSVADALKVHERYGRWKTENQFWDDCDLAFEALCGVATPKDRPRPDLMIIDEAQDLTPDMIRAIIRSSRCNDLNLDATSPATGQMPLPFLFAADEQQTINPSGFDWHYFQQLFEEETGSLLNRADGVYLREFHLGFNFRMRRAPHRVASGLRRWIRPSAEVREDESLRDGGWSGPLRDPSEIGTVLDNVSVILVPDRERLSRGVRSLLEDHLGPADGPSIESRRWGKVVSITSYKGQECEAAALVGFAERLRNSAEGPETLYAKQLAYVAASRARSFAYWIEATNEHTEWMWSRDGDGPGENLEFTNRTPEILERRASYEIHREAVQYLDTAISEVTADRETRAQFAALAASLFEEAEDERLTSMSSRIARYLRGERAAIRMGNMPAVWRNKFIGQIIDDAHWGFFDGPLPEAMTPDDRAGIVMRAWTARGLSAVTDAIERAARDTQQPEMLSPDLRLRLAPLERELVNSWITDLRRRRSPTDGATQDRNGATVATLSSRALSYIGALSNRDLRFLEALQLIRDGDRIASLRKLAVSGMSDTSRKDIECILIKQHSGAWWLADGDCHRIDTHEGADDATLLQRLSDAVSGSLREAGVLTRLLKMTHTEIDALDMHQKATLAALTLTDLAELTVANT